MVGAMPSGVYPRIASKMPHNLGFDRHYLSVDGSNQYIDCGNNPLLDFTSEDFTLEIMVFISKLTTAQGLITRGAWQIDGYYMDFDGGRVNIRTNQSGTLQMCRSVYRPFPQKGIYHIVGTRRGTEGRVYIDGDDVTAIFATLLDPVSSTRNMHIGKYARFYLAGNIYLARVYRDYALDHDEVKWNRLNYHNPVRPNRLVLWLPIEEGTGEITYDKSGNGNNGTLLPAGGPTWGRLRQWELRVATE